VLLVDDDPNVLHALARALRHQPYRIYTATSGEEAMLAVKAHDIDVVVADEHMPGMRGSECLAWIALHYPAVMRIVLTGDPTVQGMLQAINEGRVYQFFTKPCNPAHLGVAIRKALEHKELVDANRRLGAENSRRANELDDWRATLKDLCQIIANDVRNPLQAAVRLRGASVNRDSSVHDKDRDLVGAALESLARVECAVVSLVERNTHERQ
jgi:DNA-binding NtrC family response regulator